MTTDHTVKKKIIAEMAALAVEGKSSVPRNGDIAQIPLARISSQPLKTNKKNNAGKDLFMKFQQKPGSTNEDILKKHLTILDKIKNHAEKVPEFASLAENIKVLQDAITGMTDPIISTTSKLVLTGEYFINLVEKLQPAYKAHFPIPQLDVDNINMGYFQSTRKPENS